MADAEAGGVQEQGGAVGLAGAVRVGRVERAGPEVVALEREEEADASRDLDDLVMGP